MSETRKAGTGNKWALRVALVWAFLALVWAAHCQPGGVYVTPAGGGGGAATAAGLPFVTVSAAGIANGLTNTSNGGLMFGPDTVGTTTCGEQEALNSLPIPTDFIHPGGGTVLLGPGIHYISSSIQITNPFNASFVIQGAGKSSTFVVYTNNIPAPVYIVSGMPGHTNFYNLQVTFRDMGIAENTNATMIMLSLTNFARATVKDCFIGSW